MQDAGPAPTRALRKKRKNTAATAAERSPHAQDAHERGGRAGRPRRSGRDLHVVVKSDGVREPFWEEKLSAGFLRALEKRPVKSEDIDAAMSRIKKRLLSLGEREVPSMKIGELVMEELENLDHVAYVRFASVYKSFEDINAFREVIDALEKEDKNEQLTLSAVIVKE